jgi:hypothetical protein
VTHYSSRRHRDKCALQAASRDRVRVVSELLCGQTMLAGTTRKLGRCPRFFIGSLVLTSCAYKPDSFEVASVPFSGFYLSVDCLDLAIDHRKHTNDNDVIAYEFGNRCDKPVVVDFAAARVYGQTYEGEGIALYAYDPLQEIRVMRIDAHATGREALEYPSGRNFERVCVDAAAIAHATPSRWVCFAN